MGHVQTYMRPLVWSKSRRPQISNFWPKSRPRPGQDQPRPHEFTQNIVLAQYNNHNDNASSSNSNSKTYNSSDDNKVVITVAVMIIN